ncbi:MAG: hypothetical protein AB7C97_11400 [Oscillospiraceae bacterium]
MYFVILLVILIAAIIFLTFAYPVKVSFLLDSDAMDMHLLMKWLSILKIEVNIIGIRAHISVFIFNMKIVSKFLANKRGSGKIVLKALSFQDTCIRTLYGLNSPHLTGIFYGAVSFISSLINVRELEQHPEFIPSKEYLRIEASSDLNAGKTMVNLIKLKFKKSKERKNYELVKFN